MLVSNQKALSLSLKRIRLLNLCHRMTSSRPAEFLFFLREEEKFFSKKSRFFLTQTILASVFKQTPELFSWFKDSEVLLLRTKASVLSTREKAKLFLSLVGAKDSDSPTIKVPFQKALWHFKNYIKPVRNGYVDLEPVECQVLAENALRAKLDALPNISSVLGKVQKEILKACPVARKKLSRTGSEEKRLIGDLEDIHKESQTDFPPCMEMLVLHLEREGHLKHGGRMALGLFLKEAGLEMEEALEFWKRGFSKKISSADFEKNYAYNIRHNYGREGKRTSYTSYGCTKLLSLVPTAGDPCGCPFKLFDRNTLKVFLQRKKLEKEMRQPSFDELISTEHLDSAIERILDLKENKHYQVACADYLNAKKEAVVIERPVSSPIEFLKESKAKEK